MGGDAWVMDIIWHTLLLVSKAAVSVWSIWSSEILLVVSFAMQLALNYLAGFRWRGASATLRRVIWFCYVGADYVAGYALGHLATGASRERRPLLALWAPFFLLHRGGPDGITAFQLEDNKLSGRAVLEFVMQVAGALYVVVSHSLLGSWTLALVATVLLFVVSALKCAERTVALSRANLSNLRSSLIKDHHQQQSPRRPSRGHLAIGGRLMTAHSLFHICKHALVDSMVDETSEAAVEIKKELFELERDQLFEVMEMELSLMYDFLYTKASVMYTWHGYSLRVLSPLAALAALPLVELNVIQQGGGKQQSDVMITRIMLSATLVLETASLLRALASSWTGFLLSGSHGGLLLVRPAAWVRHGLVCSGRWQRFRHLVAYLGRIARVEDHRRWSGNMGQLNILKLVTSCQQRPTEDQQDFSAPKVKRYAWTIQIKVKELVYKRVRGRVRAFRKELKDIRDKAKASNEDAMDMVFLASKLRTDRGKRTLNRYELLKELQPYLGRELQLGILIWHIGTDIYLVNSGKAKATDKVEAVRTLSNYMMYLLVLSPEMLPGMVTCRLFELTCSDLSDKIWRKQRYPALHQTNPDQLAEILYNYRRKVLDNGESGTDETITYLIIQGIELGKCLIQLDKDPERNMVKLILDVWVDMLFYAAYRCSKESHAKQLANGGELTTIVWLLAEHAGLFVVPKTSPKDGT